jgi:hypothetical protein
MSAADRSQKAVDMALRHADKNDSARLCANDSLACMTMGRHREAIDRACASLAHSVGVFAPVYSACRELLKGDAS